MMARFDIADIRPGRILRIVQVAYRLRFLFQS